MRIESVQLTDVYGTPEASFQPGSLTLISGSNGTGKSSIIRAIASVFEGGHDASMIRNGAKRGQVTLTLDNGVTITKTVTPSKSVVEVTDASGLVVPAPMTFIERLGDALAVNPGKLLTLDASTAKGRKELAQSILDVMPISVTRHDILAAAPDGTTPDHIAELGEIVSSAVPAPVNLDGLTVARKSIEETRRRIGADADRALKAASQLWASAGTAQDAEADRKRKDELTAQLSELIAASQLEIEATRDDYTKQEREMRARHAAELHALQQAQTDAVVAVKDAVQEAVQPLRDELSAVMQRVEAADKAAGARETAEQFQRDGYAARNKYDRYTEALKAIDAAKLAALSSLPVPGVAVEDGIVTVDGVPWENVNTARRVEVAIQLSDLRRGDLPFMLLDDAEHLDSETKNALRDALVNAGYQLIEASVSDGPLTISFEERANA